MDVQSGKVPGAYADTARLVIDTLQTFIMDGTNIHGVGQDSLYSTWLDRLRHFLTTQMNHVASSGFPHDIHIAYGISDILNFTDDITPIYQPDSWWAPVEYKLLCLRNFIDDTYHENIL